MLELPPAKPNLNVLTFNMLKTGRVMLNLPQSVADQWNQSQEFGTKFVEWVTNNSDVFAAESDETMADDVTTPGTSPNPNKRDGDLTPSPPPKRPRLSEDALVAIPSGPELASAPLSKFDHVT